MKYFAYCPDNGIEEFETAEEAKKEADSIIDWYRDNADEGWDEMVNGVFWGEKKQEAREIPCEETRLIDGEEMKCADYEIADLI